MRTKAFTHAVDYLSEQSIKVCLIHIICPPFTILFQAEATLWDDGNYIVSEAALR